MRLLRLVSERTATPIILALAAFICISSLIGAALLDQPADPYFTLISLGAVLGAVAALYFKTSSWLTIFVKSGRNYANQAAKKTERTGANSLSTALAQIGRQLETTHDEVNRVEGALEVQIDERGRFEARLMEQIDLAQSIREQIDLQDALFAQLEKHKARQVILDASFNRRHDALVSRLDVSDEAHNDLDSRLSARMSGLLDVLDTERSARVAQQAQGAMQLGAVEAENKLIIVDLKDLRDADARSSIETIRLVHEQQVERVALESSINHSLQELAESLESDRAAWQSGDQSLTERIAQSNSEFTTKLAQQIVETEKRLRDIQTVIIDQLEAERGLWLEKLEASRAGLHSEIETSRRQMMESLETAAGLIKEAMEAGFKSERKSRGIETGESYDRLMQKLAALAQTQQSIIDQVERAGIESLRQIEGMQTTVASSLQSGGQVIDKTLEELETFLSRQKEVLQVFPRVVKLNGLIPSGCLFEVSTPVEVFRVEKYGAEKEFTAGILAELKQTDTFFDIGASVGLVSVHAGKKGVSTFAFEPDPQVRERLHINLKLNRLTNVQTVAWAVSDSAAEVTLFTDGVDGRSPSLREVGQRGGTTVVTDSIDNAIQRKELPLPDVIKIDIEGAEALALPGMKETLTSDNSPRVVFIELHPEFLPDFGATSDEVVTIIESYGYAMDEGKQRADQIHCIFRKTS